MRQNEQLVDLTRPLSEQTPVYPGDPSFRVAVAHEAGDVGFRLAQVTTGLHVGTHLDAPRHFFAAGSGVDGIAIAKTVGRANLIRVTPHDGIVRTADLAAAWERLCERTPRLLVSTGWERRFGETDFFTGHPGFEPSLFAFLKERDIVLLGVDMPSVKYGKSDNAACHSDLLGAGIVVVETLCALEGLPPAFFLSCAPLPLVGLDGSPVRAYAIVA
ncbi:MAG: cyclase family protein [Candidatus Izemoplasmatales bacterium]